MYKGTHSFLSRTVLRMFHYSGKANCHMETAKKETQLAEFTLRGAMQY